MATVDISSDSDDDSVIVIPYTKPNPPTILLDSDHEEEVEKDSTPKDTVEKSSKSKEVEKTAPDVIDISNELRGDEKGDRNKKKRSGKRKQSGERENNQLVKNSNSEPPSSSSHTTTTTRPLEHCATVQQRQNEISSSTNTPSTHSLGNSTSSDSTTTPSIRQQNVTKNSDTSVPVSSGPGNQTTAATTTSTATKVNNKKGTMKTPRPPSNYTLTPTQKRKFPHLEKILIDLQKEKELKRAQEERLKQLKMSQNIRKSATKSSGVDNRTTPSPTKSSSRKKKSKREIAESMTAADLDHLNFLKTLNLTAGIGFDDGDIQALAAMPSPAKKRKTQDISETVTATSSVPKPVPEKSLVGTSTQQQQQPSMNNSIDKVPNTTLQSSSVRNLPVVEMAAVPTPFVSIIDESVGKNVKSKKKQDRLSGSSIPITSTTPVVSKLPDQQVENPSLDIEIIEVPSQPLSTKVNSDNVIDLSDDEDGAGIFTHNELTSLQSNIQLNITGVSNPSVNKSFQQSKEPTTDSKTTPAIKRPFRYFHDPKDVPSKSSSEEEDVNTAKVHSHDSQQNSQSRTSAEVPNQQQKSPNKKRSNNSREEPSPKRRKRVNDNNTNNFGNRRLPSPPSDSESTKRLDAQYSELASLVNVNSLTELQSNTRTFPNTWNRKMKEFYGTVYSDNLNLEDVFKGQSNSHRLWLTPYDPGYRRRRGRQFKCTNCQQFGDHNANRCPEPRRPKICIMCGNVGHTTDCIYSNNNQNDRKSERQWGRFTVTRCLFANCLNCGRNFFNNNTNMKSFTEFCDGCLPSSHRNIKCRCCGLEGHADVVCPDNWRRFHSTLIDPGGSTAGNQLEELQKTVYKDRKQFYCANCGEKGHQYFHCRGRRDYNSYAPYKPYVIRELPQRLQTQSIAKIRGQSDKTKGSNEDHDKNSASEPLLASRSVSRQDGGLFEVKVVFDSKEQVSV